MFALGAVVGLTAGALIAAVAISGGLPAFWAGAAFIGMPIAILAFLVGVNWT